MPIRSSTNFIFNGESSEDYNIINCNVSSGVYTEPFASSRTIKETTVRGRTQPYFHEIQEQPISFTCQLFIDGEFTDDILRSIKRWLLSPTYYTDLTFSDEPDKQYYALVVGEPVLNHNGLEGYIEVQFRCNDSVAYGSFVSQTEDLSINPTYTNVAISNSGDRNDTYPILTIVKIGNGNVKIINLSDSGTYIEFTDLLNGEIVEIDCRTEVIENSPLGTISFSGTTNDTETVTVGSRVYEFNSAGGVTAGRVPVDISGGNSASQSAQALVTAINNDVLSEVFATLGIDGVSAVCAGLNGVLGSLIATTDTCTNASWSGATLSDSRNLYSNWNEEVIRFLVGTNTIKCEGTMLLTIRFQPKLM